MIDPMSSKKLALVSLCMTALILSACDEKNKAETTTDVANLVDTANTAETTDSGVDKQPKRASASSPGEATVTKKDPLDASLYLSQSDIRGLGRGAVREGVLVGKKPSTTYGSVRLEPTGSQPTSPDRYGAALQLWKVDDEEAAENMVGQMRGQYLGVDDAPKNAPVRRKKAFLSFRAGITTYVFAAEGESAAYVAAISCGQDTCPKGWANVRPVAEKVADRIQNPDALEDAVEQRQERAEKDPDRAAEKRKQIEERKEIRRRKRDEQKQGD
jgi:hypothetical protein